MIWAFSRAKTPYFRPLLHGEELTLLFINFLVSPSAHPFTRRAASTANTPNYSLAPFPQGRGTGRPFARKNFVKEQKSAPRFLPYCVRSRGGKFTLPSAESVVSSLTTKCYQRAVPVSSGIFKDVFSRRGIAEKSTVPPRAAAALSVFLGP